MADALIRVKICGVTNADDAQAAARLGADWIGLNFHPDSPRAVNRAQALEIVRAAPPSLKFAGVFVNRPAAEVDEIAAECGLSAVQLHGEEPPDDLSRLAHRRVFKAIRLGPPESIDAFAEYAAECREAGAVPFAWLLDAAHPKLRGGTGTTIPTETLAALQPRIALGEPLILAGGLNPENVVAQIEALRPWMVDVASGAEAAPGRKDHAKLAAFIQAVHGAR